MPNIQSVAVVPVGVTKFREGLYPLTLFNEKTAGDAIDVIAEVQEKALEKYGTRMAFAADEFYLIAKRPLPEGDFYEDYPQYENGVGLCRSLIDEVHSAIGLAEYDGGKRKVTIACGTAVYPVQQGLAEDIMAAFTDVTVQVIPILNHFFGETITVTGLITAGDLIDQLKDKDLGDELLISKQMLKADEPIFLDDMHLDDVKKALDIDITPTANDGFEYLDAILGIKM
jgi:NifB/MoaA-like Fe-S oxidoreductase